MQNKDRLENAPRGINNNVGFVVDSDSGACPVREKEKEGIGPTEVIGNDMMAVARRIRERARILDDERRKVRETEAALRDLREKHDRERSINDRQRQRLLQWTNERNAVELEIFRVEDAIGGHARTARALEEETRRSEARIEKLERERTDRTTILYAPNLARMEMFLAVLEDLVESKAAVAEKRQKRLEDLRAELEDAKRREESIIRQTRNLEDAIYREEGAYPGGSTTDEESKTETNTMKKEDHEITALSKRVREAIEEVRVAHRTTMILEVWIKCYKIIDREHVHRYLEGHFLLRRSPFFASAFSSLPIAKPKTNRDPLSERN